MLGGRILSVFFFFVFLSQSVSVCLSLCVFLCLSLGVSGPLLVCLCVLVLLLACCVCTFVSVCVCVVMFFSLVFQCLFGFQCHRGCGCGAVLVRCCADFAACVVAACLSFPDTSTTRPSQKHLTRVRRT